MTRTDPWTPEQLAETVARAKREILEDIAGGRVPEDVPDYSTLHDYVDANEYGGLCDGEEWPLHFLWDIRDDDGSPAVIDFANRMTDIVDQWLREGRPAT